MRASFRSLKPYVDDRPLSLERSPDGLGGESFYQKEKPAGMPKDTPTVAVQAREGRKVTNTVVGGKLETQLALANLGCIAVHVWDSRVERPRPAGLGVLRPRPGYGRDRRRREAPR